MCLLTMVAIVEFGTLAQRMVTVQVTPSTGNA
jgi:hypothetical protein